MPKSDVIKDYNNDEIETDNTNLSKSSSDNESSWQLVPGNNRKRYSSKPPRLNIEKRQHQDFCASTSNRFATLASNNEEYDDNEVSPQKSHQPKLPPICIPNVDVAKMVNNISKVVDSHKFYYKSLRDGQVRLNIMSIH